MQRDYGVTSTVLSPGKANVTDDADQAASGNEGIEAMLPDFIQLLEKLFLVFNVAELRVRIPIFLQRPIGRRS